MAFVSLNYGNARNQLARVPLFVLELFIRYAIR